MDPCPNTFVVRNSHYRPTGAENLAGAGAVAEIAKIEISRPEPHSTLVIRFLTNMPIYAYF